MTELGTHWEREDLGNGRFIETISIKPIAYPKPGVGLRRITNILANTSDPGFPIGVDELCQFRLDARIAGKSPLFYFGKGQSRGTFSLVGANNVSGKVNGNRVKFVNAWDNADLTYILGGHRLQEDILFKTGHPREISFWVNENVGFNPETLVFGNDFRILQPILHPPAGSDKMDVPLTWQVSQQGGKWLLTVKLPSGDFAGWKLDPTLTLQPDAADGVDTWIYVIQANTNYGTDVRGRLDGRGAANWSSDLYKFDLSSIPPGAVFSSGILSLWVNAVDLYAGPTTWTMYRILSGNTGWTETGATWNTKDGTNAWAGSAGLRTADTDYSSTSLGSFTYSALPSIGDEHQFAFSSMSELAAMKNANYGILLREATVENDVIKYNSSDYTTDITLRPKLVLNYTLPGGLRGIITGGVIGSFRGIQTGGRL